MHKEIIREKTFVIVVPIVFTIVVLLLVVVVKRYFDTTTRSQFPNTGFQIDSIVKDVDGPVSPR